MEGAALSVYLRKHTFRSPVRYGKILFLTCGFAGSWKCSGLTLWLCPCSSSSRGLTAAPLASPGRSQPWGARERATAPVSRAAVRQRTATGPMGLFTVR